MVTNIKMKYEYNSKNGETKEEIMDKYICYTPFDLIGYVARYGDISNEENKAKCTKLIVDTYNNCKDVFIGQQFFLEDETLNDEGYPTKFEYYYKNEYASNKTNLSNKSKVDEMEM